MDIFNKFIIIFIRNFIIMKFIFNFKNFNRFIIVRFILVLFILLKIFKSIFNIKVISFMV